VTNPYRLPDAAHVGRVHLQVSDLPRSVTYYEQVVGLQAESASDGIVSLSTSDGTVLVTLRTKPGLTPSRRGALGLFHFAILLPDRASLGRFASQLVRLGINFAMADHHVSEALYLWDPDGLGVEVYADRPRSAWQHRGHELLITTDPLNLDSVIAASSEVKWTGAPAATTVGHVHLNVGSLDLAGAFYAQGLGFDKTVWTYPGALFMSAGGYHHHVATNVWSRGPAPSPDQAQLCEWELVVPSRDDIIAVERNLSEYSYHSERHGDTIVAPDPWGTRVRIVTSR